jgi:hypothetical protein
MFGTHRIFLPSPSMEVVGLRLLFEGGGGCSRHVSTSSVSLGCSQRQNDSKFRVTNKIAAPGTCGVIHGSLLKYVQHFEILFVLIWWYCYIKSHWDVFRIYNIMRIIIYMYIQLSYQILPNRSNFPIQRTLKRLVFSPHISSLSIYSVFYTYSYSSFFLPKAISVVLSPYFILFPLFLDFPFCYVPLLLHAFVLSYF